MLPLVLSQIAAFNCLGQGRGLTECEAKPLARDGVHRSRRISDERGALAINSFELARRSNRSTLGADRFAVLEPSFQIGDFLESIIQAELRISRDRRDTN
jgi:hypothetical protein